MGHQFGHYDRVNGLQWIGQPTTSNGVNAQQQDHEEFVTCSSDLSVFVWRHFGDRWQFNYIDIAKCFDESLSFQRK